MSIWITGDCHGDFDRFATKKFPQLKEMGRDDYIIITGDFGGTWSGEQKDQHKLFNVLSFLSDKLLTVGNTVATLDELYIWLSNVTTIEYIRNTLKRVRKKESALIMA